MIVPDAVPATVGANFAVTVALPPAVMLCPEIIPLALKPAPAEATLLIAIAEEPEFVRVSVCVLLFPTRTFPKLKLPGLAPSVLPAATALPVNVKA